MKAKCPYIEKTGKCILERYGTCVYAGTKYCPLKKEDLTNDL